MSFATVEQEQVLEAQVAAARTSSNAVFVSGDPEVDQALAAPMTVKSSNDGRVTVYATETGEPREIPVALLGKTLIKQRLDPKTQRRVPAFSRDRIPGKEYARGSVMCLLHPDHPDYESLREVGLHGRVCGGGDTVPAAHLASIFDLEQHMAHRHSREWAVLKEHRERKQRDEEMALRREEVAAMRAMAAQPRGRGAA